MNLTAAEIEYLESEECWPKPKNPRWSGHAKKRYRQPLAVAGSPFRHRPLAQRCGKQLVKKIEREGRRRATPDTRYYIGPNGAVFVVRIDNRGRPFIVTVLPDPRLSVRTDMEP
jgi:hypothetical protein